MTFPTSSGRRKAPFLADFEEPECVFRDAAIRVEARKRMVESITRHARDQGLDANAPMVDRHYKWFIRWYEGVIATGYLMGRTGVKWLPKQVDF